MELMQLTEENVTELWDKAKEFPSAFDDFTYGNPQWFASLLLRRDTVFFKVGDLGVVYFTDIVPRLKANVHLMFWDRKLKDREIYVARAAAALSKMLGLRRIECFIPDFNIAAQKFAERCGLVKEGELRMSMLSRGEYRGVVVYAAVDGEIEECIRRAEKWD